MKVSKKKFDVQIDGSCIYLVAFSIYFVSNFLAFTMFSYSIPSLVGSVVRALVLALIIFKFIEFDTFNVNELMLFGSLLFLSIIVTITSGNKDIFFLILLIVGAKDVSFERIVKLFFVLGTIMLTFTVISSLFGVIKNLMFFRGASRRYSLGMIYPTNLAAMIFYLMVGYCYLKEKFLSVLDYLTMFIILVITFLLTATRLNALIMLFLLIIMVIYQRFTSDKSTKFERLLIKYSWLGMPVAFVIIGWLTSIYDPENRLTSLINHVLSGRLDLGHFALNSHNITMFGQFIPQNGWGGLSGANPSKDFSYFFIDSSFLRLLLMYGIIFTIVVVLGFVIITKKLLRNQNVLIPLLLLVVAVSSMFDANLLEISVNPFLWIFFADLTKNNEKLYS